MDSNSFNITYSFAERNCMWITQLEINSLSVNKSGTYRCYVPGSDAEGNVSITILEDATYRGWQCKCDYRYK